MTNKIISIAGAGLKYGGAITFGILLVTLTMSILSHHSWSTMAQQQSKNARTYHSNTTGATIIFHDHSITSKTSNQTGTNNPGITGFSANNSMRNMTNPMFLMKRNPLGNLSNPLANMRNPLSK